MLAGYCVHCQQPVKMLHLSQVLRICVNYVSVCVHVCVVYVCVHANSKLMNQMNHYCKNLHCRRNNVISNLRITTA